jgi:hypothetical protein
MNRLVVLLPALLAGCAAVPPPVSQVPDATAAIARLRTTGDCETALKAKAKIDHLSQHGRIKGDLYMFAGVPARLRLDAISPFGVALATLTSDGKDFALADLRDKRFYVGPASACNIARLTTVPLPGHVLVDLLRGQAPVLRHDAAGTVAWSPEGYYVVRIAGTREASEELHVEPRPDDIGKPWGEQRMRLLDVKVWQKGVLLYHASLSDHREAPMSGPLVDSMGLDPTLPPSGVTCEAEVPRRIHVEVPVLAEDVVFRYEEITWNPPLPPGTFLQAPREGLALTPVTCEE